MEGEKEKFLRKLRQVEEHARALARELEAGEAQNRARLIWGLAAHLMRKAERPRPQALRQLEEHAEALSRTLPAGLPLNRARQIRSMAAHLALQTELEQAGGHLHDAANDAARAASRNPA
jgi:hypothetical protein